jgi:hypothetical protein
MKKSFFSLIILVLLFSLSCKTPLEMIKKSTEEPTPVTEKIDVTATTETIVQPTTYSPPTARPTSNTKPKPESSPTETVSKETETPVPAPQSVCPQYFKETFDQETDCWQYNIDDVFSAASISNKARVSVQITDGRLEFKSELREDLFIYSFYKDNEYDEVIISAEVYKINPSANQNGFTLVCHANEEGWYEARLESSGTFEIFEYTVCRDQNCQNPYHLIANGGAKSFKLGADAVNNIEWQCGVDYLRLMANGVQIWEKTNYRGLISGGAVGVGLASYSGKSPRAIAFDTIEVRKP